MALKSIGGAWKREGKKGEFLSCKLNEAVPKDDKGNLSFLMFRKTNKKNEKQPDWDIVITVEDDDKPF